MQKDWPVQSEPVRTCAANTERALSMSRALWEEVFPEDSRSFLDYYYACVADHNRIYLDEEDGRAVSMLHRNPYRLCVGRQCVSASFFVSVATSAPYRRQGRMRELLHRALADCQRDGEPFVYLAPASEKIYLPFGFRTVRCQNVLTFGQVFPGPRAQAARMPGEEDADFTCVPAAPDQMEELAAFSQKALAETCAVYTQRSPEYYRRIQREQEAVKGDILLLFRGRKLAGYCFAGLEDVTEIRELVVKPSDPASYARAVRAVTEYFRDRLPLRVCGILPGAKIEGVENREFLYRPITMVRIANLAALAKTLRARREMRLWLNVRDDFLKQNSGRFCLTVTPRRGCLEAADTDTGDFLDITIEEFTDTVFGIRTKQGFPEGILHPLHPLYLNELV